MKNYERYDLHGPQHRNVLLAEDNPGDILLIRKKFEKDAYPHSLFVVKNGKDAMDFLEEGSIRPDVVILDINMPDMTGHEVLCSMRSNPELASIPVVMQTSSEASKDVAMSKENGANAYFVKPYYCSLTELIPIIEMLRLSPSVFVKIEE